MKKNWQLFIINKDINDISAKMQDKERNMDFIKIEKKWQDNWDKMQLSNFNKDRIDKKLYCIEMFSYPSGANLHLGHWFNFGLTDSWVKFKKMQGFEVFQPMGFDSFGLPAENYAIQTNIHPGIKTYESINTMRKQLKEMGGLFDWEHEIITCDPEYYKWTQWIFLQLFKKGLAYKKEAPVNWCDSCKTVLANEQAAGGTCERCGSTVKQKRMNQWFLKITDYADELLEGLDDLDWPAVTKTQQRNWIGKSAGAQINFKIFDSDDCFEVYTTRPDTIYGVTYIVLAPEHELVSKITTETYENEVQEYKKSTAELTEIDRQSLKRKKTGVFTGAYAIHPLTGKKLPIWLSDYVLISYGTGAIMAVPAHDERDFAFAKKFNLEILPVIKGSESSDPDAAFEGNGTAINSFELDGLSTQEAIKKSIQLIQEKHCGHKKSNYRLRDWLISRQRYWGAPIPIVYCETCGIVPAPESSLPVLLPQDVEFSPTGKSPLAFCDEFLNTTCPTCGGHAIRETDTMDTFMCSSWYQLRYPDANNHKEAFNKELINKMLPVDKYVGGKEHICLHLIYARFITKALRDCGFHDIDEPFQSLVHQGTILGPDGSKMSKSKGNTISPDEYIEKYGSDSLRAYLMFGFNYIDGGPWSDDGIKSMHKFLNSFVKTIDAASDIEEYSNLNEQPEKDLEYTIHFTIKFVTENFEKFQFNTSISKIMVLTNELKSYLNTSRNANIMKDCVDTLVKLMAPVAPHICEELWNSLGHTESIFKSPWPVVKESALVRQTTELPVQINGKMKQLIIIPSNASQDEVVSIAKQELSAQFKDHPIKKIIYVQNKILNLIV